MLKGEHVSLVTDLPASPEVDELPRVIDAAVPIWAERFGVGREKTKPWRIQAYLIGDRDKFVAARLMPDRSSEFRYGLSLGHELWLFRQESDYYQRCLLIHEATHSFMSTQLGSCGPGWYMEGMAELLGSHTWSPESGGLQLGVTPPERLAREVGRVGLLQKAFEEKRALPIARVMQIDNNQVLANESYAWVGALASFLDAHPRYQQRFRTLPQMVLDEGFNQRFGELYEQDWSDLETEWRVYIATLQYEHNIPREAIEFHRGEPLEASASMKLAADRGWQSTGVLVEVGKTYAIDAGGMFTIAKEPDGTPAPCTAGGVTLEYHAGRPLGILLAAIDARASAGGDGRRAAAPGSFLRPAVLGGVRRFTPNRTGTLYLRVNDSPARLRENEGALEVSIAAASDD
ncbi:MAG: hypothetical protein KDA37_07220 [Planctomycetales bacterium]|nr:hypothetical protein [Planctomycetales bacterium]